MLEQKLNELEQSDIYPFHMPGHKRAFLPLPIPMPLILRKVKDLIIFTMQPEFCRRRSRKRQICMVQKNVLSGKRKYLRTSCGDQCSSPTGRKNPYGEKLSQSSISRDVSAAAGSCLSVSGRYRLRHPGAGNTTDGAKAAKTDTGYPGRCHYFPDIRRGRIDIKNIADTVHAYGIPLIVDEAHGAHFGFSPEFPENATRLGADAVIMSVHKTLPAFTQTALLHLCSDRIAEKKVAQFLGIYETSSPSYLLMAGIEKSLQIIEKDREMLFAAYSRRLAEFRDKTKNLKTLQVLQPSDFSKQEAFSFDPGKTSDSDRKQHERTGSSGNIVTGIWSADGDGKRKLCGCHDFHYGYGRRVCAAFGRTGMY